MEKRSISLENGEADQEYRKAAALHRDIMANAQLAADAFVEFCRGLKQMRDSKLYTALGYGTFEDYTTQAAHLKQRQAYTYISTYERLGERFLQSNAAIGITKLELLASVPAVDREEVSEKNDIAGMSVSEVRELVEKYNQATEQLSLLQEERDSEVGASKGAQEQLEVAERERAALMEEIRGLKAELSAASPATEEQLSEIRKEEAERLEKEKYAEIEKIRKDATEQIRKAKERAQKVKDESERKAADAARLAEETAKQEIANAEKRAQEIARRQIEDSLREIEQEKAAALERATELEKKLKVASNPESVKLNAAMEGVQEQFAKVQECIVRIAVQDAEAAEKFRGAVRKLLARMEETV